MLHFASTFEGLFLQLARRLLDGSGRRVGGELGERLLVDRSLPRTAYFTAFAPFLHSSPGPSRSVTLTRAVARQMLYPSV